MGIPVMGENAVVLGKVHQPPQRWMDLTGQHLATIRQEKTTQETIQAVERQSGQVPEGHDPAENSTRQVNMEAG